MGREDELAQLAELHRVSMQRGERLAVVEGSAGSGKSRVLQEFRNRIRLDGGVVLEGRCDPGRAFGPFATIVDRALRFLGDMSLTPSIELADLGCSVGCHRFWHQHDHGDVADSREANERRLRFFDAVRGLIRDVSRVRAPVVLLHDLHRADEATLQLLRFIFEGAGPWSTGVAPERALRALFVASVLPGEAERLADLRDHEATTRIPIGTLDSEGIRQFLQSETTVRKVLERTGGVPERIELLLAAEPLSPEQLLGKRTETLPEGAQRLLEALSVVQHPSDLDLLCEVAGPCEPAARSAFAECELVTRSLLDGRILYSFTRERHGTLTYDRLSDARRAELHGRCAELFARNDRRELAAHHALEAGDYQKAIPLALEDARALASRHAHAEAAALLERVLERAPDAPTELREYLAELHRVVGEYRRALIHAQAVRKAQPESADAAHRVGRLLTLAGRLDEALDMLRDALELAGADEVRTEVETSLAELEYQRGDYDQAQDWASQALQDANESLALEIHARNTLGKVALARKEAAVAAELFETNQDRAADAGLGHQQAQALTNLGVAMLRLQRLAEAKRCFEEAVEVAERVNDSRERAIATENLAVLAHLRRDYREALTRYHEAVAILKRLGNRAMLTRVGLNLGWLYLALGDIQRARSLSEFAQHMGGPDLPRLFAAECLLLRGQIDLTDGRGDAARASLEAAHETFADLGSVKVIQPTIDLARLALDEGDVHRARDLMVTAPATDTPRYVAELAILGVDLERAVGGDVLSAAQRAVRLAKTTGDDELILEAVLRIGRALWEAGDDQAAGHELAQAQEIEAGLTSQVPDEALPCWRSRKTRERLADLESRVSSRSGRRISSAPPPRQRSEELDARYPDIAGSCPRTVHLLEVLEKVAPSEATVLVRGESGTGKELVAEALHRHSPRRDKPLVKVNCAALVETLLLSELFGHERGAFTGASSRKKGRFELADGGTLFLDEIGDISPATQVALLRVLQEREFERVGGTQPIKVDVRIIAATHRDLEAMVAEGTFREDLYYRLRGVSVEVPALRSRLEDLPELVERLLERFAEERNEPIRTASKEVLRMLAGHHWPGNIRELENVLRSASLFAEGSVLTRDDFAAFGDVFVAAAPEQDGGAPPPPLEDALYARVRDGDTSLLEMKKVIERECIVRALVETNGNITRAAALLGMKRPRLSQLVKQYNLVDSKAQKRVRS
ncbi:MAG: sigma 54-interacting transcriptional regulator [Myxococcota bacterium]